MSNDLSAQGVVPSMLPSADEQRTMADIPKTYVPAMKLLQGTSGEISDANKQGDYYLPDDELNLGNELRIVVLGRRIHAILFINGAKESESFDSTSPIFEEIKHMKKSDKIAPLWGHDWFLYLLDYQKFVSFHCGKKSTYPASDTILRCITPLDQRVDTELAREALFTKFFTLKSHLKKWGSTYKAFVPDIIPEPTPEEPMSWDAKAAESNTKLFYQPLHDEGKLEKIEGEAEVEVER